MGAYDSEQGMYTAVCKCMSGFTDAFYMDLNVKYAEDGENTSKVKYSEIEAGGETVPRRRRTAFVYTDAPLASL